MKHLGMLLLAIYLIVTGAIQLLNLSFNGLPMIMAILAVVTGILLLLKGKK